MERVRLLRFISNTWQMAIMINAAPRAQYTTLFLPTSYRRFRSINSSNKQHNESMRHGSGSASIWSISQVNDIRWTYARGKSKVWLPNGSKGVVRPWTNFHTTIITACLMLSPQYERFEIMINWHETHQAALINYLLSLFVLYFTYSTIVPLLPSRSRVQNERELLLGTKRKTVHENIVVQLFDRGGFMFYCLSCGMAAWSQHIIRR